MTDSRKEIFLHGSSFRRVLRRMKLETFIDDKSPHLSLTHFPWSLTVSQKIFKQLSSEENYREKFKIKVENLNCAIKICPVQDFLSKNFSFSLDFHWIFIRRKIINRILNNFSYGQVFLDRKVFFLWARKTFNGRTKDFCLLRLQMRFEKRKMRIVSGMQSGNHGMKTAVSNCQFQQRLVVWVDPCCAI